MITDLKAMRQETNNPFPHFRVQLDEVLLMKPMRHQSYTRPMDAENGSAQMFLFSTTTK